MPRLRQDERERAIGMLRAGMPQTDVANQFNVSRMTIYRLLVRLRDTGTTSDRRRSGRPRATTLRQDRQIRLIHLRNRFVTAVNTARRMPRRFNNRISDQTVRNRLRQCGLRARRPLKGAILKRRHRIARLQWCRTRVTWNRLTWQNILFSDESRFCLKFSDGRARVYRRRGERFSDPCVQETDRFGGGSLMVWGGISHTGCTDLKVVAGNLNAVRYRDEILQPVVLPFLRRHQFNHVFQQDNARCHVAQVSMDFLNFHHIRVLPWPAMSPDLNPIEHLWDELGRRVRSRLNPPETLDQLRRALVAEWTNIPIDFVRNLIRSMRRRCQAVINARGGHTRY